MASLSVGIDPGAQGAIVLLKDGEPTFWPMPVVEHRTSRGKKRPRTDGGGLCVVMHMLRNAGVRTAHIEDVWGIKGQAAGGAATLGYAMGCIETACAAAGIEVVKVSAVRWKYDCGVLKKGKAGAVDAARKNFGALPLFAPKRGERTTAQCEGFAEAALIARWASVYGRAHAGA